MNKPIPAAAPPKDCFIICPIGEPGSPVRSRADLLLKHVLSPVLAQFGYRPVRGDQVPKAGLITSQIINLVIDSPMVIADLTGGNPNVFYELALRHATGKPYIQLIETGNSIPFDIGGIRTIPVDIRNLDSVEECKAQIGKYIEEFNAGHQADSPVTLAAKVRLLQSDPEIAEKLLEKLEEMHGGGWKSIDDLGEQLEDIQRTVDAIQSKLDDN
jgi:hypothetical protein